jgi:hypothetical protein
MAEGRFIHRFTVPANIIFNLETGNQELTDEKRHLVSLEAEVMLNEMTRVYSKVIEGGKYSMRFHFGGGIRHGTEKER